MNKDIEAIINNACLPRFYKLMHIRRNSRSVKHPQVKPFYEKILEIAEESEQQENPVQHFIEAKERLINDIAVLAKKQANTSLYITVLITIFIIGAGFSAFYVQSRYDCIKMYFEESLYWNVVSVILVIFFVMFLTLIIIIKAIQHYKYEKVDIGKIIAQVCKTE